MRNKILKTELLNILCCPHSGQNLVYKNDDNPEITDVGWLVTEDLSKSYKVTNGIPRFVSDSNYADNFGFQWNFFARTQLDSHSGHTISADRFWKATGWNKEDMYGKWVLDVGCGSGRFAEVALSSGAKVVALDYSNSVDATWKNLNYHSNLYVVQGDIFSLPFLQESFDFVYSLGVLQHTPNVEKALKSLPSVLVKNGNLCIDVYWKRFRSLLHSKYLIRPFTKNMQNKKLFELVKKAVPLMLPISTFLGKIPIIGVALKRLIPVANYYNIYPLSEDQHKEWSILDTFDMLSPKYDSPQTKNKIYQYMQEAGINDIQITHATLLAASGKKK